MRRMAAPGGGRGPDGVRGGRGVTLVELVVVLSVVALMASIAATIASRFVSGQQDNHGRLVLAQAADAAVARIADELDASLPNSLRLQTSGGETWIEYVPVADAGRWRAAPDTVSGSSGDILDLDNPADSSFDVIGTPLASPAAGSQLVIENLGTPEADAYAGTSRRGGLVVTNAGQNVAFTPNGALPQSVNTLRFFIVGNPVSLACRAVPGGGWALWRYSGYGWQATQPVGSAAVSGATAALLLNNLSACSASYSNALTNIGLLNLQLGLGDGVSTAGMSLLVQLPIDNTP